jgi:hypothetical protein
LVYSPNPANLTVSDATVSLVKVVGGTATTIGVVHVGVSQPLEIRQLRLVAYASGLVVGWLLDENGNTLGMIEAIDSDVATGGTLASGKSGFGDEGQSSFSYARQYGAFYIATPAEEPLIVNSGRSLEVRSDSNKRESADGTTYSDDIASRGSRLFIPPAGDAGRTTRIAVRATREDPITMASRNDGDATELAVFYTPRYLVVPRS